MPQTATRLIFDPALDEDSHDLPALRESAVREVARREPPPPPPDAAELERRVQVASHAYTGHMLWAACLFLGGGAVFATVDRISYTVCSLVLCCLVGAVAVQYRGRRMLRAALIERAVAKGTPEATARSEAAAALARIHR